MTSSFTWLDYSEQEKRKALDVISLFREQETRDELGMGAIRDAFADLFFPGTNTIQTRARYFLFIPWIYLGLEQRRVASAKIAGRARQDEVALINALSSAGPRAGVIGIDARQRLQRLPSHIYWPGLETLGIRTFHGSQDQYHRSVDPFYLTSGRSRRDDDGEPIGGGARMNWHAGLPPAPLLLLQQASFELPTTEASYLQDRIMARAPGTLLAFLVDRGRLCDAVPFPWQHPQFGEFPGRICEQLEHARNFSEIIHGAALLYNLMLAQKSKRSDLVAEYERLLAQWARDLAGRDWELERWDRRRFWDLVTSGGAPIGIPTRLFVDKWLDLALSSHAVGVAAVDSARKLIHERERALKRGQARLDSQRALERWNGAANMVQLAYRWPVAQRIVADILAGLSREGADA